MVEDRLLSKEELPFEEWAVTPSPEAVTPQSVKRERMSTEFKQSVRKANTVILTHGDADGLTSAALIRMSLRGSAHVQEISYGGPYEFSDSLQDLIGVKHSGPVYILDFNPDSTDQVDEVKTLIARGCDITWFDHHQWSEEVESAYRDAGVKIHIDEDECTASLIEQTLPFDFSDQTKDLVEVTKDRDLWIREDERSEDLSTFAEIAETDEYIGTVTEVGANLPRSVLERVEEQQDLNRRLNEIAVEDATVHAVGGYEAAMTYISGGVNSEIGNQLVEEEGADIAVVLSPFGGASIYSHSDRETFARCHKVAEKFDGGGHPTAAGFGIPFDSFRELSEYWLHPWRVHHRIKMAIQEVEEDD
jgi:oligoribonuclease NrnB/cAMP/cGMP phosphodiesterase (DHH superfamily)